MVNVKIEPESTIMKTMKAILLCLAGTFFAYAAQAQSGLVARYLLNGNANNAVGTNHGTVVGAATTSDRFGVPNSAYAFNGVNSRIEFGAPPPLGQVTNWTVAAWVKPSNFTQTGLAVYVGFDSAAFSDGFGFGLNKSSALQGFHPFEAGGFFSSGQPFPATNEWAHVVMLRTNGITSFYLNGFQAPNTSAATVTLPSDFTIGSQNGVRFFNGSIDDVRIYNRAITSDEAIQLYSETDFCSPHIASAEAILFNGFVVGATITDSGCGYTNVPTVSIVGGGGSNATATATMTNGRVTSINIMNPGCCYTTAPQIIIDAPPFPVVLSIRVSKVAVTAHVLIGRQYFLEGSQNLTNWNAVTPPFVAQTEDMDFEFAVGSYQFFRAVEIP